MLLLVLTSTLVKLLHLVALSANVAGADEVAKTLQYKLAAMNPIVLNEAGVDAAIIEKKSNR